MEYSIMLLIYFTLFILFVNNKLTFIVSKGTVFLGKISFALYLTHQTISRDYIIPTLMNHLNINFWVASIAFALPISILIASFITYYIEIPMCKRMKEKLHNMLNV